MQKLHARQISHWYSSSFEHYTHQELMGGSNANSHQSCEGLCLMSRWSWFESRRANGEPRDVIAVSATLESLFLIRWTVSLLDRHCVDSITSFFIGYTYYDEHLVKSFSALIVREPIPHELEKENWASQRYSSFDWFISDNKGWVITLPWEWTWFYFYFWRASLLIQEILNKGVRDKEFINHRTHHNNGKMRSGEKDFGLSHSQSGYSPISPTAWGAASRRLRTRSAGRFSPQIITAYRAGMPHTVHIEPAWPTLDRTLNPTTPATTAMRPPPLPQVPCPLALPYIFHLSEFRLLLISYRFEYTLGSTSENCATFSSLPLPISFQSSRPTFIDKVRVSFS